MRKQILTDNETKTFLMKTFKCSRQAVWQALNFVRDSDQARRIRTLALKRGGKLTDGNFIPNCETTFEECEKTMTCTFGPRVKLVVHRKTNDVAVYVDGNGPKPTNVSLYQTSCSCSTRPNRWQPPYKQK